MLTCTGWIDVRPRLAAGLRAGAIAAVPSGVPSTVHALATGRSPFESVYAAGSLVASGGRSQPRLAASGLAAHAAISLGWGAVLGVLLPRRSHALAGAVAGLVIAALDLGLVGRRYRRVAALPVIPQVADHVAYGVIVGLCLRARDRAAR